jgi:hypothetical protein
MKQNKYLYEAFKFRILKLVRLVVKMASTGKTLEILAVKIFRKTAN